MLPARWQMGRSQLRLAVDRVALLLLGLLVIVWFVLELGGVGMVAEP